MEEYRHAANTETMQKKKDHIISEAHLPAQEYPERNHSPCIEGEQEIADDL
jgi:hypothetical protein